VTKIYPEPPCLYIHTYFGKLISPQFPPYNITNPIPPLNPHNQPPPNPNTSPYQTYSSPNPTPNPTIPPSPTRPHNLISARRKFQCGPFLTHPFYQNFPDFHRCANLNSSLPAPGSCLSGVRENDVDLIGILYLFDVRSIYALLLEEIAVFKISTLNLQQMRYARDIKSTGREVGSRAEKG